ncbi:MAG: hypothetical protein WD751_08700 [Anaerolineales bacterium]
MLSENVGRHRDLLYNQAPRITGTLGYKTMAAGPLEPRALPEKRRRLLRGRSYRFALASCALLAGFLVACSEAAPTPTATSQPTDTAAASAEIEQVDPTAIFTATEQATQTTTPTETQPAVVYTEPVPYEEIFTDGQRDSIRKDYDGGYFTGSPELENVEDYLMIDLSQSGYIRITEARDLTDNSWGIYIKKSQKERAAREITNADGQGVGTALSLILALHQDEGLEVLWGDLDIGTKIFIYRRVIDFLTSKYNLPQDFVEKKFPLSDPRYSCEEVDSVLVGDDLTVYGNGVNCEYTGE